MKYELRANVQAAHVKDGSLRPVCGACAVASDKTRGRESRRKKLREGEGKEDMAEKVERETSQAQAAKNYGLTAYQLVELMSLPVVDRETGLVEYGGVENLMEKLNVNLKCGLEQDAVELDRRRRAFGANIIPDVPCRPSRS